MELQHDLDREETVSLSAKLEFRISKSEKNSKSEIGNLKPRRARVGALSVSDFGILDSRFYDWLLATTATFTSRALA